MQVRCLRPAAVLLLSLVLVSIVGAMPPARVTLAAAPEAQEYDLKAVYLYTFLQFFQWPDRAPSPPPESPLLIGIVGDSPFGDALHQLETSVRQSGKRPVRFALLGPAADPKELAACQLVFLAASEQHRFREILAGLNAEPVITVADAEGFLAAGGMVQLVRSGGKIRWAINRAAVDRTGLRISAQLLSMATRLHGGD